MDSKWLSTLGLMPFEIHFSSLIHSASWKKTWSEANQWFWSYTTTLAKQSLVIIMIQCF